MNKWDENKLVRSTQVYPKQNQDNKANAKTF